MSIGEMTVPHRSGDWRKNLEQKLCIMGNGRIQFNAMYDEVPAREPNKKN